MCVQRATNQTQRNVTKNNGWGRMLFVLVTADKVEVGGKALGEDLGMICRTVSRGMLDKVVIDV